MIDQQGKEWSSWWAWYPVWLEDCKRWAWREEVWWRLPDLSLYLEDAAMYSYEFTPIPQYRGHIDAAISAPN